MIAGLIAAVVLAIAWSGLISLMNMSSMAEARTLRQLEVNRAIDFITDELRTAGRVNATANNAVDGSAIDIRDLLTAEGFNLANLGSYGDLALYVEIPAAQDPPTTCPLGGPNAGSTPPKFDRVIYDVRPSTSEWLGPRTLMRYGRIKGADGAFDPCESPVSSDPIADALTDDGSQKPACPGIQTGGAGFYACQDADRTSITFQNTLVDTSIASIEGLATSRLQPIQPKTLLNVGCQNEDALQAIESINPVKLRIANESGEAVRVYVLDTAGDRQLIGTVGANSTSEEDTFETHPWMIADGGGTCQAIYIPSTADSLITFSGPPSIGPGAPPPPPPPSFDNDDDDD